MNVELFLELRAGKDPLKKQILLRRKTF